MKRLYSSVLALTGLTLVIYAGPIVAGSVTAGKSRAITDGSQMPTTTSLRAFGP